jgi:transcription antitermination factor NusG
VYGSIRSTQSPGVVPNSWHVAELKPFASAFAERFLLRTRDIVSADWQIFNPQIRKVKKWSRNRERVSINAYFSGYLFINFDQADGKWPHINDVHGVQSVMYSEGNKPAIIQSSFITDLMNKCTVEYDDNDYDQKRPRYFVDEAAADEFIFKQGSLVRDGGTVCRSGWPGRLVFTHEGQRIAWIVWH